MDALCVSESVSESVSVSNYLAYTFCVVQMDQVHMWYAYAL